MKYFTLIKVQDIICEDRGCTGMRPVVVLESLCDSKTGPFRDIGQSFINIRVDAFQEPSLTKQLSVSCRFKPSTIYLEHKFMIENLL